MTHARFKIALLALALLYAAAFGYFLLQSALSVDGLALANGNPAGGDFINLWSAGRLVISGDWPAIYAPDRFMDFQRTLIPHEIGLRLWAYPPHALLVAAPFGVLPYFAALGAWSLIGLLVLISGARRLGFGWWGIVILALSPASLQNIYFGQSGNLAAGLLLMALSYGQDRDVTSVWAAIALTIKPQLGIFLPLVWLLRRKFWLVAATSLGILAFIGASIIIFGWSTWQAYIADTLPVLSDLELSGSGAFVNMIPSVFMSLRIFGLAGELALQMHGVFAVLIIGVTGWFLWQRPDRTQQAVLVLLATCLVTPYLHTYDLNILLAGVLALLTTGFKSSRLMLGLTYTIIVLCWALPHILHDLNFAGVPIGPLVMGSAFILCLAQQKDRQMPA